MSTIERIQITTSDPIATRDFYGNALGLGDTVAPRDGATATGFQGFTLSLVAAQPSDVDALTARALDAGATPIQEPKKSLWGYGGSIAAPDGTIITLASETKKDTAPPTGRWTDIVLQLGVDDVAASRQFYEQRGFTVAKSYGKKYVEFDTGAITLTLNNRRALAKTASVDDTGTPPEAIAIQGGTDGFTDPDGYTWVPVDV